MAVSQRAAALRDFILEHLDSLYSDGGSGTYPELPERDLYALDYLEFAEKDLAEVNENQDEREKTRYAISCLANLKRALENQLDVVLHVLKLTRLFSQKKVGVPAKLDLLRDCGILSTRTLARLNRIRNRVEHEYEVPETGELEAFCDVVALAVAVLQTAVLLPLSKHGDYRYRAGNGADEAFSIRMDLEGEAPKIAVRSQANQEIDAVFEVTERDDYCLALRALVLLGQIDSFASAEYIRRRLTE